MRSQTLTIPESDAIPTTQVFRSLVRTFGLLKRVMEPHFTTVGISGPQWAILRTLREVEVAGEPEVRLSDLGARLLVRPPSVTGIVRRLKDMGLIEVAACTIDQRAKTVTLTEAGRHLVETFAARHEARVADVFAGLAPHEREQLLQLLTRFGVHLERLAEEEPRTAATIDQDVPAA
jgi:DNA-binding MarR family transcriptional regulator